MIPKTAMENTAPIRLKPGLDAPLRGMRDALASVCAVAAAQALGLHYPLYALVAAVIVSDASMETMKTLGWQRMVATAFGALVGAALSIVLGRNLAGIGLAVFLMIVVCYSVGLREAAKISAYVAGIVVLDHGDSPWLYAMYRFIETALGIACAYVVGLIFQFLVARLAARDGVGSENN